MQRLTTVRRPKAALVHSVTSSSAASFVAPYAGSVAQLAEKLSRRRPPPRRLEALASHRVETRLGLVIGDPVERGERVNAARGDEHDLGRVAGRAPGSCGRPPDWTRRRRRCRRRCRRAAGSVRAYSPPRPARERADRPARERHRARSARPASWRRGSPELRAAALEVVGGNQAPSRDERGRGQSRGCHPRSRRHR